MDPKKPQCAIVPPVGGDLSLDSSINAPMQAMIRRRSASAMAVSIREGLLDFFTAVVAGASDSELTLVALTISFFRALSEISRLVFIINATAVRIAAIPVNTAPSWGTIGSIILFIVGCWMVGKNTAGARQAQR